MPATPPCRPHSKQKHLSLPRFAEAAANARAQRDCLRQNPGGILQTNPQSGAEPRQISCADQFDATGAGVVGIQYPR